MKNFFRSLSVMLGKQPVKPIEDDYSQGAQELHALKRTPEKRKQIREMRRAEKDLPVRRKWMIRRWASVLFINFLFVASFALDIQLVEGSLTGSRVLGFHFADLTASMQIMLASKAIVANLLIGTLTVLLLWWLLGGRSFCAWACPYHLLAEIAEMIHLRLKRTGWSKDYPLHRSVRVLLFVIFLSLAYFTGYTVFEMISPVGIISRALVYGPGMSLLWVVTLLLIEIFLSRRAWCRYICPIGLTYGALGSVSPVGIQYNLEPCLHEGECLQVCMVPHVLECTKVGRSTEVKLNIGADCTRCGMCIDACPTGALTMKVRGLDIL